MEDQVLYAKLKNALVEVLNIAPEAISPQSALMGDLGADSMDIASLMTMVGDDFDVELDADGLTNDTTVQEVITLLRQKVAHSL